MTSGNAEVIVFTSMPTRGWAAVAFSMRMSNTNVANGVYIAVNTMRRVAAVCAPNARVPGIVSRVHR